MAAAMEYVGHTNADKSKTFRDLGLDEEICDLCDKMGWKSPSKIQAEAIPAALNGEDVIGIAETGTGKTAAFALPIMQALLNSKQRRLFALIVTPTRELAHQICEEFDKMGEDIKLKTACITGGGNKHQQELQLAKMPHVVVGTVGRLAEFMTTCIKRKKHKNAEPTLNMKFLKYLVLDEADIMLRPNFEYDLKLILDTLPKERHTYLFSATETDKVSALMTAELNNPVKIEASVYTSTVPKLRQELVVAEDKEEKELRLMGILENMAGKCTIIFCKSFAQVERLKIFLKEMGIDAIALHGHMRQEKREKNLENFKAKSRNVLITTDVAARGLDVLKLELVINFDLPANSQQYVHRVGRTARAGSTGFAITIATRAEGLAGAIQKLETVLKIKRMRVYELDANKLRAMYQKVQEAKRNAHKALAETPTSRSAKLRTRDKKNAREEREQEAKLGVDSDSENEAGPRPPPTKKQKKRDFFR